MRINLEKMLERARSRVHSVYFHQLNELDEANYSLLIRNHRATLARLRAIAEGNGINPDCLKKKRLIVNAA